MLKQFRKNYDFFDAPVGMILCVERRMGNGQWIDCGIFLDQLMLLAREKGLHTCPQAAFSRYQHVVRRELEIPDDQVVICGLALGHADPDAVPNNLITERAPIAGLHDLVHGVSRARARPRRRGGLLRRRRSLRCVLCLAAGVGRPADRAGHQRLLPDFLVFHAAGRAWLEGQGALIYDSDALTAFQNALYADRLPGEVRFRPFFYPPTWLLMLLPFAALAVGRAYALFLSGTAALATVLEGRHDWKGWLAILVSPAAVWVALTGQNTFLSLALFYGGFRLLDAMPGGRRHPARPARLQAAALAAGAARAGRGAAMEGVAPG